VLKAFSCAAGVALTDRSPKLVVLMTRLRTDVLNATHSGPKVPPIYAGAESKVCVPTDKLGASAGYPSDQAAWGVAVGMVLSELYPERVSPLMARGRAYGDSASICGVSAQSAIQAGRLVGAAMMASLQGDPAFRADLDAARTEAAGLRTSGGAQPMGCDSPAAALAGP
jgi:acid phosphatase (class A)